jgi:predicted dehydrogenase
MATRARLKYGMVGGGPGASIGAVHRVAAAMDDMTELVAGAFSSDPAKSRIQGEELGLDPNRVYGSYEDMARKESSLPEGERIDFVSIVTPNHLHFPVAKVFIEHGFHVVCDKPMTTTVQDAEELVRLVRRHGTVFALTHNYTGYPMVRQARAMVAAGRLGRIRKMVVEYPQDWLATLLEADGHKQASWRTDPAIAGASSCVGDIGSHAENLARYITGLEMESLIADLTTFVEGRKLEDDANMLIRFKGGARAVLYASQVSIGEENHLAIRIYGETGKLQWDQEDPNYLWYQPHGGPAQKWARGNDYNDPVAAAHTRVPPGHPEGYIEAFANIYRKVATAIIAAREGRQPDPNLDFPTVLDGAIGVHFIHKAVESAKNHAWVDASYNRPG